MKYRSSRLLLVLALTLATSAWAQWSSDPSQNLALSNIPGADQVQPKLLPLPDNNWYVSWFNNNPNDPPPQGYDVYYQLLSAKASSSFSTTGYRLHSLPTVPPKTMAWPSTAMATRCWRFSIPAATPTTSKLPPPR